jgi:hypothetical protein
MSRTRAPRPLSRRAVRSRPGWTRLSAPGRKLNQHWRHETGWEIRHCGHPTANWPFYAVDPTHPTRAVVSHNGLGFVRLAVAFDVVERVLAGELAITNRRCGSSTRRVLCTAAGEPTETLACICEVAS